MPSRIQEMLADRNDLVDYKAVIKRFPWLVEKNKDCILSPDSDGLLCGLFVSNFLGWKIRGFYDGKIMVLEEGFRPKDCIFLDMEVFREGVRSIGQHMVMFNKEHLPENWGNFENCASINNIRNHDGYHDFRLKYPFGTIHFLIGVLGTQRAISIPKSAIAPLLFTDGTWMNLLGYTENSLSWLKYLRADQEGTPLNEVFLNKHYSLHELMLTMNDFLRERDSISVPRERGDRITITLRGGEGTPHNLVLDKGDLYYLTENAKARAEKFLMLLSKLTGWQYKDKDWSWAKWKLSKFTKGDFVGAKTRLSNRSFNEFIAKNPISFAMTSTQNIEYTLEGPDAIL
ncbi:MAG: Uncharacterized protein G01um101419_725 [Parcubacteria group bacterium Gr01-1014_19]|nr:MAG: Uncharacterized protein G01um101419_725 [Parcubacteria group bacterium Gr01-1014_19]